MLSPSMQQAFPQLAFDTVSCQRPAGHVAFPIFEAQPTITSSDHHTHLNRRR